MKWNFISRKSNVIFLFSTVAWQIIIFYINFYITISFINFISGIISAFCYYADMLIYRIAVLLFVTIIIV